MFDKSDETSVKVSECQGCNYCLEYDCPYDIYDDYLNIREELLEDYYNSVL